MNRLVLHPGVWGGSRIQTHFINQLKQAAHIKHGTTQLDGLQSEMDKKELWHGTNIVARDTRL